MHFRKLLFTFFILPVVLSPAQNKEIDSLKNVVASRAADTIKLQAYSDLGWIYSPTDFEQSKKYVLDELSLAQKIGHKKWIAQAYNDIGITFHRAELRDSALYYYNQSLALRKELKDKKLIGSSLSKIGVIYQEMDNYSMALKTQFEALKIFEADGVEGSIAICFNNISMVYHRMRLFDKEIEYGEKALELYLKNKDMYHAAQTYTNLGTAYREKKNLDKADEYLQKAYPVFEQYGDLSGEAGVLNNLGINYKMRGKLILAGDYYQKAYDLAVKINERSGIILYGHNIAVNLLELKKYAEAEKYELRVLEMIDLRNKSELLRSYRLLTTIYGFLNEGKKADHFFNKYVELKDSLFVKENATQVAEMEVKYQTEKKNLEIARNKAELEAKDRRDFIKNMVIITILVVACLLGLLFFSFYRRKQIRQKAAADAELAKQKELRSKAVIEAEEKERRRIAQDLHDGVGQILSAAKLNLSGLESKLKLEDQEQNALLHNALDLVNDSVKEVRAVSHNMMPNTLIKSGLASAIREFISKMSSIPNLRVDLEIVGLDERLDATVETILYRVIQEAVSNIIKHAKANQIGMQLIRHEHELTVMIEDNGVGFDKSIASEGIGLKNIISRVEFLNGKVDFDSTIGQGTTVIIEIPLN